MFVKLVNEEPVLLNVDASTLTLGGLRRLITEQPILGVPKDRQHLIHAGRALDGLDEQVLATLGIEDDAIIHLCKSLHSLPLALTKP